MDSPIVKVIVTIGLVGMSIAYIYSKLRPSRLIPIKPFIPVGVVKRLFIYPIKSLKPIECDQVNVVKDEPVYWEQLRDRSFVLVNGKNIFITQRAEPKLVLLQTQLIDETIKVTSPNGDSIAISLSIDVSKIDDSLIVDTKVWDDRVKGIDCGPEVSRFFSDYLGKSNIRLLRFDKNLVEPRPAQAYSNGQVTVDHQSKIMYQDAAPVLIINDKSIESLNHLLTEGSVSYLNFRPNILIESNPFDEDNWEKLIIGPTQWQQLKKCTRCIMTTVDTDKGTFMKEPMVTMKKHRKPEGKDSGYHSPLMGILVRPETCGTIKVGDSIMASHKL